MRLLLINYEYPPIGGGAGNATMFIGRALVALGHEVTVLTAAWGPHQGETDDGGIRLCRVKSWRPRPDRAGMLEMATFALVGGWKSRQLVRRHRIEAAIVFFTFPCGPIGYLLHWWRGTRYVVSLRGGDVPGLVPELETMHRWLAPLRRRILRAAVGVIANDRGLAALAEKADHVPTHTVFNGVDTEFFSPGQARAGTPFRWLFAGRFQAQKNLRSLLDQFARLRSQCPPFTVAMVGDGPLFQSLHDHAVSLGLSDMVQWHRWLDKPALLQLYRSCDGFVNPSHYEGMPNTVLEAMACGLPVVASAIPGNDTLVQPGQTGWLFPVADEEAFRACLIAAMEDPVRARRFGMNGRERVQREFSWTTAATSYLAILGHSTPGGSSMNLDP